MATHRNSFAATLCLEAVPSALLAGAVGYAASAATPFGAPGPLLAWVAAPLAGLLSWVLLHRLGRGDEPLPIACFEPAGVEVPSADMPELLLTEFRQAEPEPDELLLDDPIQAADADSRVVRLFDPARMPTAGELHSRIERHLRGEADAAVARDATEELHQALMELRRSLR